MEHENLAIFRREASGPGLSEAVKVYNNPDDYSILYRRLAYRYLYQHSVHAPQHCPSDHDIAVQLQALFYQCMNDIEVYPASQDPQGTPMTEHVLELADIALDLNAKIGEALVNVLREKDIDGIHRQRAGIAPAQPPPPPPPLQLQQQNGYDEWQARWNGRFQQPQPQFRLLQQQLPDQPGGLQLHDVLADSQNVHNHQINEEVKRVAYNLLQIYRGPDSIFREKFDELTLQEIQADLIRNYPLSTPKIIQVFRRISIDNATFNIAVTLEDLVKALWLLMKYKRGQNLQEIEVVDPDYQQPSWLGKVIRQWVNNLAGIPPRELPMIRRVVFEENLKEWQNDFKKRLVEEICDMAGYCGTGHLSRFVNVMQGFVDDDGLQVHRQNDEQCNAVVRHFLTELLKTCEDEDVLEGMIGGEEEQVEAYKTYLRNAVDGKRAEWIEQHGEGFGEHIDKVVNDFAHVEVFTILVE